MEETRTQQISLGFKIFKIFIVTIQIPINMFITYFYKTYIEIIICMLSFQSLRYMFPKTYHSNGLLKCIFMTAIIFWFSNIYMIIIGVNISIFINVLIGFLISYLAYIIQDYIDLKERNNKIKGNRNKIIELLNGDVSLDNILEHCKKYGIIEEVGKTVDLFLRKTINDVCKEQYLSETAVKKRIRLFIEKGSK